MYTRLTVFFPAAVFGFGVRRAISGVVAGTNRPAGEASLFGAGDVDNVPCQDGRRRERAERADEITQACVSLMLRSRHLPVGFQTGQCCVENPSFLGSTGKASHKNRWSWRSRLSRSHA